MSVILAQSIPRLSKQSKVAPKVKIDYTTFVKKVNYHKIKSVKLNPNSNNITYIENEGTSGDVNVILNDNLIEKMMDNDVKLYIDSVTNENMINLMIPLTFRLLSLYVLSTIRRSSQPPGMQNKLTFTNEVTNVTFKDIAGIDEVSNEVYELVQFLKDPESFESAGAKIPKGCLLYGNPGTGKTLLAKAIAGEANVPFLSCSASQFVELFVGLGASRIRTLFENAKKSSPCILFIDEIDSIGKKRGSSLNAGGGNDEREQTLNQLLTEMDGFNDYPGVIVIGATNRLELLDDALLRPGRFDRKVYVPLPNVEGRAKILEVHSKQKSLEEDVDLIELSNQTIGFTGADLCNLMNESAISAAKRSSKSINKQDIENSLEKILIGLPKNTTYTPSQKENIAYHEAGHALICYLLKNFDNVTKISILPRGSTGGVTIFSPNETTLEGMYNKEYLIGKLMVALGGHAAEEVVYGKDKLSNGAVNDLKQVTDICYKMVKDYGFSSMSKMSYSDHKNMSEFTKLKIDDEVQNIIDEVYSKTLKTLKDHIHDLILIKTELVKNETLSGEQLSKLLKYKKRILVSRI